MIFRSLKPIWWPGADDEAVVGLVRRAHQHGAEALVGGRPFGDIDLHFVEPLLVEHDRAARAERLQLQAALAAPGAAADVDRAGAPPGRRSSAVAMSKVSTARRPPACGRSA